MKSNYFYFISFCKCFLILFFGLLLIFKLGEKKLYKFNLDFVIILGITIL